MKSRIWWGRGFAKVGIDVKPGDSANTCRSRPETDVRCRSKARLWLHRGRRCGSAAATGRGGPWKRCCRHRVQLTVLLHTATSCRCTGWPGPYIGHQWHSQEYSEVVDWDVKWVVGVAGGDGDEGANGMLLVAKIPLSSRSFLVGAGWSMGRSLDAQNAKGTRPHDTVNQTYSSHASA